MGRKGKRSKVGKQRSKPGADGEGGGEAGAAGEATNEGNEEGAEGEIKPDEAQEEENEDDFICWEAVASAAALACPMEIKRVGSIFRDAIDKIPGMAEAVGGKLQSALEHMKNTGVPMPAEMFAKLQEWMAAVVELLSDAALEELQQAVTTAVSFGVEELGVLWGWLGQAIDAAIQGGRELVKVGLPSIASAAAMACQEQLKNVAHVLLDAIKNLPDMAEAVGEELKDGLQSMYETGVPVAARLLEDLKGWVSTLVDWLGDVDVERLQRAVSTAVSLGVDEVGALFTWLGDAVDEAIEGGRALVKVARSEIASAAELARIEELKNLARYLLDAMQSIPEVAEQVGEEVMEAVQGMYETGNAIAAELFAKFQGCLKAIVDWLSNFDVERLQRTVNNLVALGVEGLGLLWGSLGDVVENAIESGRELVKVNMPTMAVAAFKACQEELKNLAKLLLDALDNLPDLAAAAGKTLRDGLRLMHMTGAPLAAELLAELRGWLDNIVACLSDEAVEQMQQAVSAAVSAGMEWFRDFFSWLSEAVDKAIEEGRALAKVVLPAVQDSAALVVESLEDIYNSVEVQEIIGAGFGVLDDAYTMSADALAEALQALQGITAGCCGCAMMLLKLEICRDFMQTVGTMFSKLFSQASTGLVKFAQSFWGAIFNFFTVDLYAIVQSETFQTAAIMLIIILAVACFIAFIVLLCYTYQTTSNKLREGHEFVSWKERRDSEQRTVQVATYVLTLCLSAYLPVSSASVNIINCSPEVAASLPSGGFFDCQGGGAVTYVCWLLLLFFTVPFPLMCLYAVSKNKPQGSILDPNITYDEDGLEVPFSDCLYLDRVESDPDQVANPYRSLYRGFERKWAWYKVVQILIKLMLAVPAIVILNKTTSSAICCLLYFVFCFASLWMTPFLDNHNDIMDFGARAVALITCFGALFLSLADSDGSDALGLCVGLVINLVTVVNVGLMIVLVLMNIKAVQISIKNRLGLFDFRDTCTNRQGPPSRIMPCWDLKREIKHRVWHSFWDSILVNACGAEVAERNLELKMETRNYGFKKIKAHWAGEADPVLREARWFARKELEGVDLHWNGEWGKVWIDDYPFHLFMVYDNSSDVHVIWEREHILSFKALQTSKRISRRRGVRQKLRALSRSGAFFEWPFSRWETIRVPDGFETDPENNTQRQLYSEVNFNIQYTNCRVHVAANDDVVMAPGFSVSANYNDGWGEEELPRTGERYTVERRSAVMDAAHIGVYDDFEPNRKNARVFRISEHSWRPELEKLLQEADEYRRDLIAKRVEANKILSDGFWFNVYNNESITMKKLCLYLMTQENNPILNEIPKKHGAGLNFLFKRMKFCNCHPAVAVWYCFWDELWNSNKNMEVLQPLSEEINPFSGRSVAYTPMPREKLEPWLSERGLLGSDNSGFCRMVKPRLITVQALDALYKRMDEERESARHRE